MSPTFENRQAAKDSINRLIFDYCAAIDSGNLKGMAKLFEKGTWYPAPNAPLKGESEVFSWLEQYVILYDGVPKTRHVTTNIRIDLAQDGKSASASSYVIIYQSHDGSNPKIMLQGAYDDTFLLTGDSWHFDERHVTADGMGDTTKHINA